MNHPTAQKRILVIDDEQDMVFLAAERLTSWDYQVLAATSGEAALQMVEEQPPDLILLDILMPKMKGREVCARLRADPKTQDIPIIFLTALGMPDHIKAGLDAGAEDYLVKPFEPHELRERIEVCLSRHQSKEA